MIWRFPLDSRGSRVAEAISAMAGARGSGDASVLRERCCYFAPQHFLYLRPLPHEQGSFLPGFRGKAGVAAGVTPIS